MSEIRQSWELGGGDINGILAEYERHCEAMRIPLTTTGQYLAIASAAVQRVVEFGSQYADHIETCGYKEEADGVREFCKALKGVSK